MERFMLPPLPKGAAFGILVGRGDEEGEYGGKNGDDWEQVGSDDKSHKATET